MNFLNGGGLLAALLPLLALPFVIHLFNKRFPKSIEFPDLERLIKSHQERSRLMRWRHLLMTLLRTLAVLLALLAFLRPVLPRLGSDQAASSGDGRTVLLMLDRSFSLTHQGGAGTSAERTAQIEAGKILASLGSEDRVNCILIDAHPTALFPEFTSAHDEVRSGLAALPPSFETADVRGAIALATSLVEGREDGAELYFVSDFQRKGWADIDFEALPAATRLFFVDASPTSEDRENIAVLSAEVPTARVSVGEPIRVQARVANWSSKPATVPVEAILDDRTSTATEIDLAPWSSGIARLELTAPADEGFHHIVIKTPEDGLPADNQRHLRIEVEQRESIILLSDLPANAPATSGATFLEAALDPFDDARGAYTAIRNTLAGVTPAQLGSANKILLSGIGQLSDDTAQRIISILENGGGLIYFLDGAADSANLAQLDSIVGQPVVPFHVAGQLTTENFGGGPQKIARGEFDSPFLSLFRGERRQALGLLEFYTIQRALPTGQGEILLEFADGSPAMGLAHIGLGTAIFCNFTPSELSSNLARQRAFPAWIQEMVKHLSPRAAPDRSPEVGSMIATDVWRDDLNTHPLVAPDGSSINPKRIGTGERIQISFSTSLPGAYRVGPSATPSWLEVANIDEDESDLRTIDADELSSRSANAPVGSGHFVKGADDYAELASGRPIFHWFVLGLAALLFFEMLLHRPFQRAAGGK